MTTIWLSINLSFECTRFSSWGSSRASLPHTDIVCILIVHVSIVDMVDKFWHGREFLLTSDFIFVTPQTFIFISFIILKRSCQKKSFWTCEFWYFNLTVTNLYVLDCQRIFVNTSCDIQNSLIAEIQGQLCENHD